METGAMILYLLVFVMNRDNPQLGKEQAGQPGF
jgi:hypothetical protein